MFCFQEKVFNLDENSSRLNRFSSINRFFSSCSFLISASNALACVSFLTYRSKKVTVFVTTKQKNGIFNYFFIEKHFRTSYTFFGHINFRRLSQNVQSRILSNFTIADFSKQNQELKNLIVRFIEKFTILMAIHLNTK